MTRVRKREKIYIDGASGVRKDDNIIMLTCYASSSRIAPNTYDVTLRDGTRILSGVANPLQSTALQFIGTGAHPDSLLILIFTNPFISCPRPATLSQILGCEDTDEADENDRPRPASSRSGRR